MLGIQKWGSCNLSMIKPISRMLYQPRSLRQHSALCALQQPLFLELSWAIHCLVTSAKRSGDPTKSLFLCTTLVIPLYPVLPVHSNEIENAVEKKSCGFLSSRFSFASHSSPWEAGLHGNWYSLILPWLPLSSKDIGESLLDLQHLKYNWQILRWIQRSKFSMTTMLMLTDFVPEVRNWAFFSIFFLSE